MIIVNFKNYKTGKKAVELARLIGKHLPRAIVAVPAGDVDKVSDKTKLRVFAQHVSAFHKGKTTGFVIPEFVKKDGGKGSLLNHSEHRISEEMIKKTVREASRVGLKIVLCVKNVAEAKKYKKLKPWAMAFEDKKLIGSGKSITQYKAKDVEKFVKLLKGSKIIPICGAGVSSAGDVVAAKKLGCRGVLIASAIAGVSEAESKKLLLELRKV